MHSMFKIILRYLLIALLAIVLALGLYRFIRWGFPPAPSVYKIAMDNTWYPLSLYGKESAFTAFSTDILTEISRRENIKIELIRSGPKRLQELLKDRIANGIITAIAPEPSLENEFYFSDPYYKLGAVLIVRKDSQIKDIKSLENLRIAISRNSPILYRIPLLDQHANIVAYDSPIIALEELVDKKVDGVVINQLLIYLYFRGLYRDKVKVATLPLTPLGLRLVTLQDRYDDDLIKKFNAGLTAIQADGTYEKLLNHWDLYNPEKVED